MVPSVRRVRDAVSDPLDQAITKALAKTPADRFETAGQFAEALARATAEHPAAPTRPHQAGRSAIKRGAAAAALAVLALAGAMFLRLSQREPAAALDPRHIAVLYFDPRRGQDSLEYLTEGVTEELIHMLSGVPALRVISRNGVAPYRRTNVAPESIARALNVGTLVDGTLSQSADRLRLDVWLIDGSTGAELGSTSIERRHQEIFALQGDLAKEVSIFLRQRLGRDVKLRESRAGTQNPRAWQLLLQAEGLTSDVGALLVTGDTSGAARRLRRADSLLALAERMDPRWQRPSVARGRLAFQRLDLIGTFDKHYTQDLTATGLEHAARALSLQSDDPDALELRGTLRYYRWVLNLIPNERDASQLLASAQADLEAAVAGNPTAASAWTVLSHLLMAQSRPSDAKLAALRAYEADPYLSSAKQTIWRLFQSSLDLGDGKEAKRWCGEGRQRFPASYRFAECQIWLYALKGQRPDVNSVWRHYQQYLTLTPPNARTFSEHYGQMIVAIALARAGLRDSADAVARRARADTTIDATRDLANLEAIVRTLLGERDEAFRQLSLFLDANPQFRDGMARDQTWWFQDLRKDPRYQSLLQTPTPDD
jgi:eukaryotic-like serine/threonine-protein kinase